MKENRLEQLEIHHLKTFLTLYQVQNTTKTANKLGVSQSAITRTLKKLRETFDDQLFIRTQTGLVATEYAEKLYHKLPDALDSLLEAFKIEEEFDPCAITEELRIALHPACLELIGTELYNVIKQEAPNARVRLDNWDASTISGLLNSHIHLALNHDIVSHSKELYRSALFQDELCFYSRKEHRLTSGSNTLQELSNFDIGICIGTEIDEGMKVKSYAESLAKMDFTMAFRCGNLHTAIKIVSESDTVLAGSRMYLACYPDHLAELNILFPEKIKIPFSVCYLQKNRNKDLYIWLETIISKIITAKMSR